MKKGILLLAAVILLSSCNSDDDSTGNIFGNWVLTAMYGGTPNVTLTGADLEWQESYQLHTDGTFLKSRERDGVITEASGTYVIYVSQDGQSLELTFDNDSDIIASCTNLIEYMIFQSETSFNSTWLACDGPGLTYEKLN